MTSRTVVDSVTEHETRHPGADVAERALAALRERFPGVVFDRYHDRVPVVGRDVFLAPSCVLVGDVRIADGVSVWYGCVLRGDVNYIEIGEGSNVQDGSILHVGDRDPTVIGRDVVVGHRAVVHGCRVGDRCLVGVSCTILDGVTLGAGSLVGAGAVVSAGQTIEPRSLVLGVPGRVRRTLTAQDEAFHEALAGKYRRLSGNYLRG